MRLAVIGVGHLGRHHARILASMPDVTLVAVVDTDATHAAEVAAANSTVALTDAASLAGRVDAVVVSVPTTAHVAIALPFLEAGVGALVEKPLCENLADADRLIAAAARTGAVLAVGHSERFNPAVVAARPHIREPRFIEVHRLGTPPGRSLDIDVVFDLMIHDLDLILDVVDSPVEAVEAVGVPVLTPRIDIANVRLRFASGCIANLTASRISRDAVRKIRFFRRDAYVSIDSAAREVELWRLEPQPDGPAAIRGGKLDVPEGEPLRLELEDFVGAVRDRRAPEVTGAQGRAAIALAARIVDLMGRP